MSRPSDKLRPALKRAFEKSWSRNRAAYEYLGSGLERVFSAGHEHHDRIFYDRKQGSYYDRASDMFITLEQVKAFGLPV